MGEVKVVRGDELLEEQAILVIVTISPQMVVRVIVTNDYIVSVHIKKKSGRNVNFAGGGL